MKSQNFWYALSPKAVFFFLVFQNSVFFQIYLNSASQIEKTVLKIEKSYDGHILSLVPRSFVSLTLVPLASKFFCKFSNVNQFLFTWICVVNQQEIIKNIMQSIPIGCFDVTKFTEKSRAICCNEEENKNNRNEEMERCFFKRPGLFLK